jgi:type IV pilus assembly protein PilW
MPMRTTIAPRQRAIHSAGLTLVELMISIAIGLVVMLAATALLLSSKSAYTGQDEEARMDESGRYALEIVARAVRQAGYLGRDGAAVPIIDTPAILGLDASTVRRNTPGIEAPSPSGINHSDVLAVRYLGSGSGSGDGTILNCAGFSVPADGSQGSSIFYVAADAAGEPQLYCKYAGSAGWTADAVVRGVESFQVLYGVDADEDGLPERMLPADAIGPVPEDAAAARDSLWARVVAVRVALLMRATGSGKAGTENRVYDLFGNDYGDMYGAADHGTRIDESGLAPTLQRRMRRIYSTTIQVRNPAPGAAP